MTPGWSDDPWTSTGQLVFRCRGSPDPVYWGCNPAGFSGLPEHAFTKESGILGKKHTVFLVGQKSRLDYSQLDWVWTPLV